jgi:diguanylate cyclase
LGSWVLINERRYKRFGANLARAGSEVSRAAPGGDLVKVIGRLMAETHSALEQTKSVTRKLAVTSREVKQLRNDLEATRREASLDSLTGLLNRRYFDMLRAGAVAEANSDGAALSLLLADIDHFKRFNDTFGHPIGDQVLKLVSAILMENIRGKDTAARYGGEEFAILLPSTAVHGAVVVAETIRQYLSDHSLVNKKTNKVIGNITVSIGVAQYHQNEPVEQFMARSDDALYEAKNCGRNRVVASEGPSGHCPGPVVAVAVR